VCPKEPDAGKSRESMQSCRLVAANNLVNERRTRHQQNANEGEKGAVQRRKLTDGGECIQWAVKPVEPAVTYPHRADDQGKAEDSPVQITWGNGPTTG